jgi:hypothetical protein
MKLHDNLPQENKLFIVYQNIKCTQPLGDWSQEWYDEFMLTVYDSFENCDDKDYQKMLAGM